MSLELEWSKIRISSFDISGYMARRDIYIACYDISETCSLNSALRLMRRYATGGQRSVHELHMTTQECAGVIEQMRSLIEPGQDRFLLARLDPRSTGHVLGKSAGSSGMDYFHIK